MRATLPQQRSGSGFRYASARHELIGKGDEVIRLSQLALDVRRLCTDRDGLNDLGWVVNRAGTIHKAKGRYPEAIQAFTEVIKLRPNYPDGYTNVGLTEIVWEKYESARTAIRRALSIDPGNARALYYDGLLQRRAGNTEQEIADFRKVIAMFPESRDARRELGITYYQQNDNQAAMEQFEALQRIDPDDLTAHYNLSILYRRMGKPQEAAEQQAMFVDKKVDPGAPTYSLNYLRVHPEISTESVPWHLHSDLVTDAGGPQNGK